MLADKLYRFVKHYSPYCPHCRTIAPLWQTLYEFYYTSAPLEGRTKSAETIDFSSPNSFHGYYNFHFASINCIAFGEECEKHKVNAFPTFLLYKDGELVEKYDGKKTMEAFSNYVEEKLEQTKPGSRPRQGLKVPEPGARSVDRTALPETLSGKDKDVAAGIAAGEKHNDRVAALASLTNTAMLSSETAKNGRTKETIRTGPPPNPKGSSVPLTAETFQKLVTTTQDPWF